mgnify:CR=1|tara:strand:- start:129 stop:353 length:225 start_codon:yes stop_codon:yes gene_type:complete
MKKIDRRLEYVQRTWNIELPENLESALEEDYILNSQYYTDDVISKIKLLEIIVHPHIEPGAFVKAVRSMDVEKK